MSATYPASSKLRQTAEQKIHKIFIIPAGQGCVYLPKQTGSVRPGFMYRIRVCYQQQNGALPACTAIPTQWYPAVALNGAGVEAKQPEDQYRRHFILTGNVLQPIHDDLDGVSREVWYRPPHSHQTPLQGTNNIERFVLFDSRTSLMRMQKMPVIQHNKL